jgi:hypothetical protein
MDRQRSSHFGYSQQSTPSSTSLTPRHICSLCGKSRSKRYHDQHPLLLGQAPEPGICSRPKCAKTVNEMLRPPCPVIIYEIHHHYPSSSGLEGPPPSYTAAELRLSDNSLRQDLSPIREESPPSMNITSGPEETPQNYTSAELSGESSLTGRVELPHNRCSRRHAFRRVSPMTEELPPPVNFLKKPTLQKK